MSTPKELEGKDHLFVFNSKNQSLLTGQSKEYEGKSALYRSLRWLLMTTLFIGLPVTVIISFLYTIILRISFTTLFLQSIVLFLILVIVLAFLRYRRNIKLNMQGQIISGMVDKYTSRMTYSFKGYKVAQLLHFKFQSPTEKEITGMTFVSQSPTHLPDGRSLPEQGTKIAILYVNDNLYIVL